MWGGWPLVGRAEEIRLTTASLIESRQHGGVIIAGPAGVGKSRLAREVLQRVEAEGFVARWAVGTSSARSIPLGALAQWCDGVGEYPLQLVRGVIDSLIDTPKGSKVVVAVDDAHLLDDLSAFVLHQLVLRRVAGVIVTVRSGEPVSDAITSLWKDAHLQRLELQPLSKAESDILLRHSLGGSIDPDLASRMWRYTRGNVLYLRHLVEQERAAGRLVRREECWAWTGDAVVSASLIALVELHVGALPGAVSDVIDTVAVAEPLDATVLTQICDPIGVDDAEARGLLAIEATNNRLEARITHPLYGEVRRARSGPWRLRRLRGRVVSVLRTTPEIDVYDTVRRGVLWANSDLSPDSELLLRAAYGAMTLLDLPLAEQLARMASWRPGSEAKIVHAHALILLGRTAEADELLATIPTTELSESMLPTFYILRAAALLWGLARPADSWKILDRALANASSGVAPSLLSFRVVQLAVSARPAEAIALAGTLEADRLPDLAAMDVSWGLVIALGDVGRVGDLTSIAERAYGIAFQSREAAYQGVGLVDFHVTALDLLTL